MPVMPIIYESKDLTSNKAFLSVQEQCFLWERVAPFGLCFGLFQFADTTCTENAT